MTRRLAAVSVGWLGISMVWDGVPAVLLPHRLLASESGGATELGLMSLVAIVLAAAVQPLAGRLSDVVGRWPVVAVGAALAVAGLALLLSPSALAPGVLLAMIGASVAQAGYQALLPDEVRATERGRAAGLKSALDVAGATVAFIVLAALLADGGVLASAAVLGGALIATLALGRVLLPKPIAGPAARPDSPRVRELRGGFPPGLIRLVVARFVFLLGIYAVGRFLLLYVADRLDLTADAAATQAGLTLAALAVVSVVAAIPAGWLTDRLGRGRVMLAGGVLAMLGIGLLPIADTLAAVGAFGVLMAVGSAAFSTASWAALTDLTPSHDAGRLLGLANLGTAGAAAAAGAFGLLIDAGNLRVDGSGYVATFVLAGFAALTGGILAWRTMHAATRASTLVPVR